MFMRAQLRADVVGNTFNTSVQAAKLQEKRTALRRRIDNWRTIQAVYMPGVLPLLTDTVLSQSNSEDEIAAERIQLWLPSSCPAQIRTSGCLDGLSNKEWRLRRAQADEALNDLRQSLCVQAHMVSFKSRNTRGQRPNTRANRFIKSNQLRTCHHADRYCHARSALLALDAEHEQWQTVLKVLNQTDITPLRGGLYDPEKKRKMKSRGKRRAGERGPETGEAYQLVSWIWLAPGMLEPETGAKLLAEKGFDGGMHDGE